MAAKPKHIASLPPLRVLIATSDPAYGSCLEDDLEARGMTIARHPLEQATVLAASELATIDVLLVEIHEPATLEWGLLERVRQIAPLVEVVAVSADPAVQRTVQALRTGVYAVLEYPVSSDLLAATLTEACRRKRRAEARMAQLDRTPTGDRQGSDPGGAEPAPRVPQTPERDPVPSRPRRRPIA